jgi:hypothetical protein
MSEIEGEHDDFVHLRVVDKVTGDPQPGAEIFYLDATKYDVREWQSLGMTRFSPDDVREWYCTRTTADFRGEARIPRSPDVDGIEARLEDHSCTMDIDPYEPGTVVVRLERARAKRVIVVDEHGAPVGGVPLVLFSHDPSPVERAPGDGAIIPVAQRSGQILWFGRSRASDGEVEIARWRRIEEGVGANARIRLCALADFVTEHGIAIDPELGDPLPGIDARGDDREPLKLTVPPTGTLVVDVRRADGTPAPDRTLVQLFTHSEGFVRETDDEPVGGFWTDDRLVENGRAIFPAVWLGRSLAVSAWSSDGSRRSSAWIDGPRAASGTVTVAIALGERLPTLTGRLLDDHGAPMPWAEFDVRWSGAAFDGNPSGVDADVRVGELEPVTDRAGRFRLDLVEPPPTRADRALELEFKVLVASDPQVTVINGKRVSEPPSLKARVRVSQPLEPGDIELGDIVLARETTPK